MLLFNLIRNETLLKNKFSFHFFDGSVSSSRFLSFLHTKHWLFSVLKNFFAWTAFWIESPFGTFKLDGDGLRELLLPLIMISSSITPPLLIKFISDGRLDSNPFTALDCLLDSIACLVTSVLMADARCARPGLQVLNISRNSFLKLSFSQPRKKVISNDEW